MEKRRTLAGLSAAQLNARPSLGGARLPFGKAPPRPDWSGAGAPPSTAHVAPLQPGAPGAARSSFQSRRTSVYGSMGGGVRTVRILPSMALQDCRPRCAWLVCVAAPRIGG